jgi:hypothetical protein
MSSETEARQLVTTYLMRQGFPESLIASDVITRRGQRADLVIYRGDDKPLAVIEVKPHDRDYPDREEPKLRFHPYVRQVQLIADQLRAPYYLLTNGNSFLWFTTDISGWPRLLDRPITPELVYESGQYRLSKEDLVRALQEFQRFLFWKGGMARSEETAILILAKLMSEAGDDDLKQILLGSRDDQTQLTLFYRPLALPDLLSRLIQRDKDTSHLAKAFDLLDDIDFREADPKDVLRAFDETLLNPQMTHDRPRVSRWLADFLVRLAHIEEGDVVLDLCSSYGDVLAAARLQTDEASLWGITDLQRPAVWAQIQQLVLNNHEQAFLLGSRLPYDIWESKKIPEPNRIVTAPSFGGKLDDEGSKSFLHRSGIRNVEDLYAELALDWIAPKGRVVILVPESLLSAGGKREITREVLVDKARLKAVISLPVGILSPYSVIKTSILVFDKDSSAESSELFMARVDDFEVKETFDSREIPELRNVLEQLSSWEEESVVDSSDKVRIVKTAELNLNNLTVANYLSETLDQQQISLYPFYGLESVSELIRRGVTIKLREYGDIPVIGPAAIRPLELTPSAINKTSSVDLPPNAPTVEAGDVVINLIGNHLGEAALVGTDLAGSYISVHVALVRPDRSKIHPEYLAIALSGEYVQRQIAQLFTGALIKGLPLNKIKKITLPLPSLNVQRQIIDIVSRAHADLDNAKKKLSVLETSFSDLVRTVTSRRVRE